MFSNQMAGNPSQIIGLLRNVVARAGSVCWTDALPGRARTAPSPEYEIKLDGYRALGLKSNGRGLDSGWSEMNLDYEFTMRFAINVLPEELESLSVGRRLVHSAESGSIEGERIKAKFAQGIGTTLIGADRYGNFEIRARFLTNDNVPLYVTFDGFIELSDKAIQGHAPGVSTEFGDPEINITLRIQSDHPKYSWLNHTVFVGEGRFVADGLEYKVYRLG